MNKQFFLRNLRSIIPAIVFLSLFTLYISTHPRGLSTYVLTIWSNQTTLLVFAALAQFFVVIVRGIDLSVGATIALTNVIASYVLDGSSVPIALGVVIIFASGAICGLLSGVFVAYLNVPSIIATLATGAIFNGIALWLRPTPGGSINEALSEALTYANGPIPTSLIIIIAILLVGSYLMRRSSFGLSLYAVGSSEHAAELTGIKTKRIRLFAHIASGLCAAAGGFYVAMVTSTGDAGIAPSYTLNSIAAIVLGGVSLAGGIGNIFGVIIGAMLLKIIASLMFFSGIPPLAQPFFEGLVLALAIAAGSISILRNRNQLKMFPQ